MVKLNVQCQFTVKTRQQILLFEMEKVHLPASVARDYPFKLRIGVAGECWATDLRQRSGGSSYGRPAETFSLQLG